MDYLTPGVYFETFDVARRGITTIRTDIAAFVGIAEQGLLMKPTPVNSWQQFQATFGGFIPQGYLAYTVKAFFENGGQTCYVVRVASAHAATESLGLQPDDPTVSVVESVAGFVPGAVVTVYQVPDVQRDCLLFDVDRLNRHLIWKHPLDAEFVLDNPDRPLYFETGAAPAKGILRDEYNMPTLEIKANSPGTWGNELSVRIIRSSPAATRTADTAQPADRSASLVKSVVGFAVGTLVKAFQEQMAAVPLETYRIVTALDPGSNRLTWNTPLDAAYALVRPISFETLEFALTVYRAGQVCERFSRLSLVTENDRFVERIINVEKPSHYIRVEDRGSSSPWPARLPDPGAVNLNRGLLRLQAGRDGIAALQPEDFTGDCGAQDNKWGLRALEDVDDVAMVAIPDILIQPTPPVEFAPQPQSESDPCLPGGEPPPLAEPLPPPFVEQAPVFSLDQVFTVQQALVTHCEFQRDRLALLDPPLTTFLAEALDIGQIQNWRRRFDSKYGALYYPWVRVCDPLRLGGHVVRAIPPSGHVAGIYARTDLETGVHKAPANETLYWAQDVTTVVDAKMQGLLNPIGINCIRSFPGRGLMVYGARTISRDSTWRYVNVRRLLMMIEEAIEQSIQWAVFEPNDFYLRQTVTLAISSFLQALWERGALVGTTAAEAFFVKCDEIDNPIAVIDLGQLIAEVGVAPVKPAEFVVFRIGRTENELEIVE